MAEPPELTRIDLLSLGRLAFTLDARIKWLRAHRSKSGVERVALLRQAIVTLEEELGISLAIEDGCITFDIPPPPPEPPSMLEVLDRVIAEACEEAEEEGDPR